MTSPNLLRRTKRVLPLLALLVVAAASQGACSDTINNYNSYESALGGSTSTGGQGASPGGEGGVGYPGAPEADTAVADHELDLFGKLGNRFWFAVSDDQLEQLNEAFGGGVGGPVFDAPQNGDLYSPGGDTANFADHLWITNESGKTADYGKVEIKLVGQSTGRPWNPRSIPNLNIDSDEFVEDQKIGGFEHLRLNNAQVGSIFREHLTLELYDKLGYPAPLSNYAWVSSNVWGAEVSVPYVLVERYKKSFCKRQAELVGGGCENMWEFVGDFAGPSDGGPLPVDKALPGLVSSIFDDPANCQIDECENTRVKELESLLVQTQLGAGFKSATADYVDWPSFHRFQCLSWVLATGDDALHNQNNVVLIERKDGKFQYLPYSVDISLGQDWYPSVPLAGQNVLARGCQSDESCWADMITECEDVLASFKALEPVEMLDALHDSLDQAGMLRSGDEARYEYLRAWFEARLEALPEELEANREAPMLCDLGQVDCGGYCDFPENCGNCVPPNKQAALGAELGIGGAGGDSGGASGGAGGGDGNECPVSFAYTIEN